MNQNRKLLLGGISIVFLLVLTGCCGVPTNPQFDVSVSASPSTFSAAGQLITFSYTVNNPDQNMRVQIQDEALNLLCDEFWLQPQYGGATEQTCTFNYMTTQADVMAGIITNSVVVHAATEATGGCAQTPAESSKTASVDVTMVYDSSTASIDSAGWSLVPAACNMETNQVNFTVNTGYDWLTQSMQVAFEVSDTETEYTCETSETPGMVNCRGSQSKEPGNLTFCLQRATDASATCKTFTEFPDQLAGLSCAPDWEISYAACDGPTQVYFTIDTHYDWLDNSGIYGYTATDGQTDYWCDTSSTAGIVYCYGTKTVVTGPLEFCFQRPEDTVPLCKTFDNFAARVNALTCEPTPTVAPACSSISNPATCNTTPGCFYQTSPAGCFPKP